MIDRCELSYDIVPVTECKRNERKPRYVDIKERNAYIAQEWKIRPAVIYLAIVTLIPAILALPISFTDWTALTPRMHFAGLVLSLLLNNKLKGMTISE